MALNLLFHSLVLKKERKNPSRAFSLKSSDTIKIPFSLAVYPLAHNTFVSFPFFFFSRIDTQRHGHVLFNIIQEELL